VNSDAIDVDRRAGQRQQRACVGREREREQELARRAPQPHRRHDRDRQQRGHRAVDADQRGQRRGEQQQQNEQPRPALPDASDELLPGPGRDPGRVEALAHDEQRGDEQHRRIADRLVAHSVGADRGEDVANVVAHRVDAQVQLGGDLARRAPALEQVEHLRLPGRERKLGMRMRRLDKVLDQPEDADDVLTAS
jgi:hypothetical protein